MLLLDSSSCSVGRFPEYFLAQGEARRAQTLGDLLGTQKTISETFGRWNEDNASDLVFLSLSKNQNNLLMSSHYCDCHRGFIVGFDATHPFFTLAAQGRKSALRKVNYSRFRPIMPAPTRITEVLQREHKRADKESSFEVRRGAKDVRQSSSRK